MQSHEDAEKSAREGSPEPPGDAAGARPPTSHRKRSRAKPDAPPLLPDEGPLALPRGGLAAMRMSGGLRFSSSEIVVYRSGKLVYRRTVPAALASQTRQLPLSQLVELHVALKNSGLARLPARLGRQNPDAFAYEIVARVGRVVRAVEVFDGSIPDSLAPLIRELKQLMPEEEA